MKSRFFLCLLAWSSFGFAQTNEDVISLEEYLAYVKTYHPIVKQANLITTKSEAKLLKSRGAFDPKLEVNYDKKAFKELDYYDKLNTTFKIPTWYGIELKANYENNSGIYLNPEQTSPSGGLYSAGVSVSLAKGLLINERMAMLKQAKLYVRQTEAKQSLLINDILYQAVLSYFNWLKKYKAKQVYDSYQLNAKLRLDNVKKSFFAGDKPAIDTLEATINLKTRQTDFEKAKIEYIKSSLELSNYLWLNDNLPLELEDHIIPDENTIQKLDSVLNSSILNEVNEAIEYHPKLKALEAKKQSLVIDKQLKRNNMLPTIDLEYNVLTTNENAIDGMNPQDYKGGVLINFPLFLRKERGDLRLAKLELQDIEYDISASKVVLKNKIKASLQEIEAYKKQHQLLLSLVSDYEKFVSSEIRKFSLGEGSLFLVNYREVKLIESQLKSIDAEYQLCVSRSGLLHVLNSLN